VLARPFHRRRRSATPVPPITQHHALRRASRARRAGSHPGDFLVRVPRIRRIQLPPHALVVLSCCLVAAARAQERPGESPASVIQWLRGDDGRERGGGGCGGRAAPRHRPSLALARRVRSLTREIAHAREHAASV